MVDILHSLLHCESYLMVHDEPGARVCFSYKLRLEEIRAFLEAIDGLDSRAGFERRSMSG